MDPESTISDNEDNTTQDDKIPDIEAAPMEGKETRKKPHEGTKPRTKVECTQISMQNSQIIRQQDWVSQCHQTQ